MQTAPVSPLESEKVVDLRDKLADLKALRLGVKLEDLKHAANANMLQKAESLVLGLLANLGDQEHQQLEQRLVYILGKAGVVFPRVSSVELLSVDGNPKLNQYLQEAEALVTLAEQLQSTELYTTYLEATIGGLLVGLNSIGKYITEADQFNLSPGTKNRFKTLTNRLQQLGPVKELFKFGLRLDNLAA